MSLFRRVVIGTGEFCALLLVVGLTVCGGWLGYVTSSAFKITTATSMSEAIRNLDIGVLAGGVMGFLISMVIAATLCAAAEIAKNTSERWFQ